MEAEANADSRRRAEAEQTLVELRRNRTALDEEMRRVESELRGGAAAEVVSTPLTSGETQVSGDDFTLTLQPCVLCLDRRPVMLVVPCGHRCICEECMPMLMRKVKKQRECPLCRGPVKVLQRVFD